LNCIFQNILAKITFKKDSSKPSSLLALNPYRIFFQTATSCLKPLLRFLQTLSVSSSPNRGRTIFKLVALWAVWYVNMPFHFPGFVSMISLFLFCESNRRILICIAVYKMFLWVCIKILIFHFMERVMSIWSLYNKRKNPVCVYFLFLILIMYAWYFLFFVLVLFCTTFSRFHSIQVSHNK